MHGIFSYGYLGPDNTNSCAFTARNERLAGPSLNEEEWPKQDRQAAVRVTGVARRTQTLASTKDLSSFSCFTSCCSAAFSKRKEKRTGGVLIRI
jgi:hypothetical protein